MMATYYVDQSAIGASDSNVGSKDFPFLTLAKANTAAVSGDTVVVAPGLYREQVACKNSGVSWKASAPGVKVYGTVLASGSWSSTGTAAYSLSYTAGTTPLCVLVDGEPYMAAGSATTTTAKQFYYDSSGHVLYVDMGGTNPTGHAVEVANTSGGFVLSALTNCRIEGFKIFGSSGYGIRVQGGGNHTIVYNEVLGHASGGIRIEPVTPQLFSPADAGAGGSLSGGTYAYVVTAVVGGNETLPSFERTVTVAAGRQVQVQWSNVTGATSYNVYGRGSGSETLLTTVAPPGSGFPTWIDDGSATPDGTTTVPTSTLASVSPCTIEGNNVWRNLSHGIYLYAASGCLIRGNRSHHNSFHGVALLNGSTGNTVEFNRCYSNSKGNRTANGIQCDNFGGSTPGSSNNILQRNRCFRNEDSGISIYNGSNGCIVRDNILYLNGDHGIDNLNSQNCHMINNVVYGNVTAGLNSEGASQGIRMFNNISMDNGVNSPRTSGNYRVDGTANQDAQTDHNLSYLSVPAASQTGGGNNTEITWGTVGYYTLDSFRSAISGQQTNSKAKKPQFTNLATYDFTLKASSPARALGTASAPDYSSTDFKGKAMGSTPNAGPFADS